jgi:hypothetical protein
MKASIKKFWKIKFQSKIIFLMAKISEEKKIESETLIVAILLQSV